MELASDACNGGTMGWVATQFCNHTLQHTQMFGLIYTGPANHLWHQFMARMFRNHKETGTILRKVCVGAPQHAQRAHHTTTRLQSISLSLAR